MELKNTIFFPISEKSTVNVPKSKISIVGVGAVGMACAYSILTRGLCRELAFMDVDENRVKGEVLDLQQGQQFLPQCSIMGSGDTKVTENSNIIIICAGLRQKEGESRLNLVQRNVDIFKGFVPQLVKYSPDCLIIVVSNPVDILSYVTWKISGLSRCRVFGTGTMLDSARFRYLLSQKLGVSSTNIHGYILGEHGDHSVPIWSGVNIAGNMMKEMLPKLGAPDDPDDFNEVFKTVVTSAYEIIRLKGYTSWAIGATVSALCHSLLTNTNNIYALSVLVKHDGNIPEFNSLDKEVFMSLPCVINGTGISHIVPIKISEQETVELTKSAKVMEDIIRDIKW